EELLEQAAAAIASAPTATPARMVPLFIGPSFVFPRPAAILLLRPEAAPRGRLPPGHVDDRAFHAGGHAVEDGPLDGYRRVRFRRRALEAQAVDGPGLGVL